MEMADATIKSLKNPVSEVKFEGLALEKATNNELIDGDSNGQPEAIVKEEEVITKRRTELTTTKQIETRVKRQVMFEDGKVIDDSGPVISTNTTEDTDKVESKQTERKTFGEPDVVDGPAAVESSPLGAEAISESSPQTIKVTKLVSAPREDGLVREEKQNRVVSREDTTEVTEVEDVHHFGDFSDAAYVNAVNSGSPDIAKVLLSPKSKKQLVPLGPKLIQHTTNTRKTVDTEDTETKCLVQPDGTLVTEKKKTTEHEDIIDEDLPDNADNQSTGSQEKILKHKESSQRYQKQRDEQEVEYVSDGKIIAKEMRYAAETELMERDGSKEDPADWDSLSDRVKKSRRQLQKSLMQKQRETLADRTDALTKRPLDFDREEQTRLKETTKWLDSHFGSESTSKDSRDESISDDVAVEPTKKTFFNVTIKSSNTNNNQMMANNDSSSSSINLTNNNNGQPVVNIAQPSSIQTSQNLLSSDNELYTNKMSSPSKVFVPEREIANYSVEKQTTPTKTKYFQGISDWSERRESKPLAKTSSGSAIFNSKAFKDELSGTLERKQRLIKQKSNQSGYSDQKYAMPSSVTPTRGSNHTNTNIKYLRSTSREDLLRSTKEDLGYLSGSRTDLRHRKNSDDYVGNGKRMSNGYLHREDSGFVRDSKEDLRYHSPPQREDSFHRDRDEVKQPSIQRDDSAYVSSSTYFTTPRSPRRPRSPVINTPDSGIRSPTPPVDIDDDIRPIVPQRKKAIEKKMKVVTHHNQDYANYPAKPRRDPPIDYSPPPRSRSISPIQYENKKSYQKTRFSTPPSSTATIPRSTQTTQTTQTKKKTVGNAIGNSLRKLVGKIRSASAERKLKLKSTASSKRSPSPLAVKHKSTSNLSSSASTYQQYNVIDGHINGNDYNYSNKQRSHSMTSPQVTEKTTSSRRERTVDRSGSSTDNDMPPTVNSERTVTTTHHTTTTMITSPKQRYYLGENPYGGSIFGKENKYNSERDMDLVKQKNYYNHLSRRQRSEEPTLRSNVTSTNTLGRFSKSTNRLVSNGTNGKDIYATPISSKTSENYHTSSQTLPRKLDHSKKNISSSTINVSIVNNVKSPVQNTGPAKPARTYKSLQRSKSFNVHGLNGTNDPSPIYMEKLTNNNYKNYSNGGGYRDYTPGSYSSTTHTSTSIYKSTPHLNDSPSEIKLKSPSIVNLISRSTRDLSQINGHDNHSYIDRRYASPIYRNATPDKRSSYLKNLSEEEDTPSKNIKFVERESTSTSKTSSRGSPVVNGIGNKDPVGILRRSSNSTDNDNYTETYKYQTKSSDPLNPTITNTTETFSKKIIPANGTIVVTSKDGRPMKKETIVETHEIKKVTSSRNYTPSPTGTNLKYYDVSPTINSKYSNTGNGGVVIELRNNY